MDNEDKAMNNDPNDIVTDRGCCLLCVILSILLSLIIIAL